MAQAEFSIKLSVTEKGVNAPQYRLEDDIDGKISLAQLLQYMKNALIKIADDALVEEQAKGFDKTPVISIDGRINKPIASVSPFGKIIISSRVVASDLILDIYNQVRDKSPVLTGQYVRANFVTFNGQMVASDLPSLKAWLQNPPDFKNNDIIRFVNAVPYARKLERYGITATSRSKRFSKSKDARGRSGISKTDKKGREFKAVLAPNGVYYLAYRNITRIYKFNSKISFGFLPGNQLGLRGPKFVSERGESLRDTYKKTGSPYLYPTISVKISEAGIL